MSDNIFTDIPETLPEELTETLLQARGVRVERIVSYGHASAPDEWYEQQESEWVLLLSGGAIIEWADNSQQTLAPGDYVFIPAGKRHRVAGTLANEHSLWLAIFFNAEKPL